ncbi:MAG: hypothetical protein JWQ70_3203 [Aeromicrobium sp.]|jgi:hypothetical protein|nr:hypothetical protein [Aeromicrobium sp.]
MAYDPRPVDGPIRDAIDLTVTLFGDADAIDQAISEELGRRGCRTHSISMETGWLASTTNAIVRIDTPAGASALEALSSANGRSVHVVAICQGLEDSELSGRLRHLCEECSTSHEVSLIWHAPMETTQVALESPDPPARHLALAIVDQVAEQSHRPAKPSFSIRSVAV